MFCSRRCLWTYVEAAGEDPRLYTFAAIADDPPFEVAEAGMTGASFRSTRTILMPGSFGAIYNELDESPTLRVVSGSRKDHKQCGEPFPIDFELNCCASFTRRYRLTVEC